MRRITIGLTLAATSIFLVGCGSGIDGPNGEDVWYELQDPDSGIPFPAECIYVKVRVYEGGDMDLGKDSARTFRYCLKETQ